MKGRGLKREQTRTDKKIGRHRYFRVKESLKGIRGEARENKVGHGRKREVTEIWKHQTGRNNSQGERTGKDRVKRQRYSESDERQ